MSGNKDRSYMDKELYELISSILYESNTDGDNKGDYSGYNTSNREVIQSLEDQLQGLWEEEEGDYTQHPDYNYIGDAEAIDTIDIFLMDGVDFDSFDMEELENDDLYFEVFPTTEELHNIGFNEQEVLDELGIEEGGSNFEVRYFSLPEEYYFTPEEGGVYYSHFDDDYTGKHESEDGIHTVNPFIKGNKNKQMAMLEEFMDDELEDMEKDVFEMTGIDCDWLEMVIVPQLEVLRETYNASYIKNLDMTMYERTFRVSTEKGITFKGYFTTSNQDLGMDMHSVHFIVELDNTEGVWVFTFSGAYPTEGELEEYKKAYKEHPDLIEFMLEEVSLISKEELENRIREGY